MEISLGIQEGERVLVIVYSQRMDYREAFCAVATIRGAKPAIIIAPVHEPYDKVPSELIVGAMNAADVLITSFLSQIATNQFVHKMARKDALCKRVRFGGFSPSSPGFRMFTPKDLMETRDRTIRLAERLTAKSARVTTELGTEVTVSLEGRKWTGISPIYTKAESGRWAGMPNFSEAAL